MSPNYYRIGAVAQRLGVSKYHLRRLADEGLIQHRVTPSGQLQISDTEIERLEEHGVPPVPATTETEDAENDESPTTVDGEDSSRGGLLGNPSRTVISSAEKVLECRHKLQKMQIEKDIEQIRDWHRDRRAQKARNQAIEEQQRLQLAQEQQQLQTQEEEERLQRTWLATQVQHALKSLPYGVPEHFQIDVRREVELALHNLRHSQSPSLVASLVRAASAKALEPYHRQQETEEAVAEGLKSLDFRARLNDWRIRAESEVRTALKLLGERSSLEEKRATAKTVIVKINREFEHLKACEHLVAQSVLWNGTEEERRRAKLAVEKALEATPVGSSEFEMQEVKNRALKPFEEALEKRREQEERKSEIEDYLGDCRAHIEGILRTLESEGVIEFDSPQELAHFSRELQDDIEPRLREELTRRRITPTQFRRLVEALIEEEIDS